jgi:hypothetical protein
MKNNDFKLASIEAIARTKRLDAATDYLIKVECENEEVVYLPLRIDGEYAISCYYSDDSITQKLVWVKTTKKRTLKATVRLFLKDFPYTVQDRPHLYSELNRDDSIARRDAFLIKRKWRVHEVAIYEDGYFVARLSCTKATKYNQDNQFVIYPASFQDLKYPQSQAKWGIYPRHGTLTSSVKTNARDVYHALRSEGAWPSLSNALKSIQFGYNTEREAKAGFKYLVQKLDTTPRLINYNVRNAIRQHRIDNNIDVEVCDRYENIRGAAWLIRSEQQYFIVNMDAYITGSIKVMDTPLSTAFTTIEESAADLMSQTQSKSYSGCCRSEAGQKWQEMIEADLRQRYFIQNLRATWLITEIASHDGECVALKALCLPDVSPNLPFEFQSNTFHIIYSDNTNDKIVAPSPWAQKYNTFDKSADEFKALLAKFLKERNEKNRLQIEKLLPFSRGYTSKINADDAWNELSKQWDVEKVDGEACSIPHTLKNKQFEYNASRQRSEIKKRIQQNLADPKHLTDFNNRIGKLIEFPQQLIAVGLQNNLCTPEDAINISIIENKYRYELTVDLFNTKANHTSFDTEVLQRSINSEDTNVNELSITNSSNNKRNAGRKKIHADEKERKRVWAKKNRDLQRQQRKELGHLPKSSGRPKKHENNAAKQASYRFRRKWSELSENAAIVYVAANIPQVNTEPMVNDIARLLTFFTAKNQSNIICISVPDLDDDFNKANGVVLNATPPENVYAITSQNSYLEISNKLKELGVNRVLMCGFSITDVCYRMACYLQDTGFEPHLINGHFHADDNWEREVGIKLFKKKFGKQSVV